MEYQMPKIGDRAEMFCPVCQKQLGQVVRSITQKGNVSRVECSKCGRLNIFKSSAKLDGTELIVKIGVPYDRTKTYRAGQTMDHPNFGIGEVTTVLNTKTVDVLFRDHVRRLIHSR